MDYFPNQNAMFDFCGNTFPLVRARLARNGRERMLLHHRWDRSMVKLDTIIVRCLEDSHLRHAPVMSTRGTPA